MNEVSYSFGFVEQQILIIDDKRFSGPRFQRCSLRIYGS